jgi:hypothetical protein
MKIKLRFLLGVSFSICLASVAWSQGAAPAMPRNGATAQSATAKAVSGKAILAPAETLSGTIWMVDATNRIVVVRDANGIPFDFEVVPSTHIKSSTGRLTLRGLSSLTNSAVTVRFLPERRGDVAESIMIG